jgi:hypothetical protein
LGLLLEVLAFDAVEVRTVGAGEVRDERKGFTAHAKGGAGRVDLGYGIGFSSREGLVSEVASGEEHETKAGELNKASRVHAVKPRAA